MLSKRSLLAASSGLAAILIATPVSAEMSAPNGWFLEGNVGSAHLSNTNYPGSSSSSGIGGNANLGYKFMPYFAVEMGYSRYPNSDISFNSTKAASVEHYSYDIAARGILPISDSGAEGFAKIGAQRIVSSVSIKNDAAANQLGIGSSSHSSTGIYVGLGGQMYFTPELAVVVQWQRAQGNSSTGTEDLFTLGLSFLLV
ncbi:MAG: porin family protein [Gammaproteobacteria bacterium]|nr:porin family protein [Gammaproteobacteria bacterium]MCW5583527.1 porin family protein [Gammaproteobacteria bacterium]